MIDHLKQQRYAQDLDTTFAPLAPPPAGSHVALIGLDLGTTHVVVPAAAYRVRIIPPARPGERPTVALLAATVSVVINPGLGNLPASDNPGMPDLRAIDVYQEAFTTRLSDYRCDPAAVDDSARIAADLTLKNVLMPGGPGRLRAIPCTDPDRVVLIRDDADRPRLEAQWVTAGGVSWGLHIEAKGPAAREAIRAVARQLAGPPAAIRAGRAPSDPVAAAARVAAGDRSAARHLLDVGALDSLGRQAVEEWLSRSEARPADRDAGP